MYEMDRGAQTVSGYIKPKIDSLQAIRGVAFLGIYLSHTQIKPFQAAGEGGVALFLILSGFLMIYQYYDSDIIRQYDFVSNFRFGIKKIMKLYPLHIITMLASAPLLLNDYKNGIDLRGVAGIAARFMANSLLIQSWIPSKNIYYSLNSVSWYLSVSLFLYTMFPLVLWIIKRYKRASTSYIFLVILILLQAIIPYCIYIFQSQGLVSFRFTEWFVYIFPLSRLLDFCIGCNLGFTFLKKKTPLLNEVWATLMAGLVFCLFVFAMLISLYSYYYPQMLDSTAGRECWWRLVVIYTIPAGALVYLSASNTGILNKLLSFSVLQLVGNLSGYAFLIHQVVIKYLWKISYKVCGEIHFYIVAITAFVLTIVFSYYWNQIAKGKKGYIASAKYKISQKENSDN